LYRWLSRAQELFTARVNQTNHVVAHHAGTNPVVDAGAEDVGYGRCCHRGCQALDSAIVCQLVVNADAQSFPLYCILLKKHVYYQ
jgi:hypothetical protein